MYFYPWSERLPTCPPSQQPFNRAEAAWATTSVLRTTLLVLTYGYAPRVHVITHTHTHTHHNNNMRAHASRYSPPSHTLVTLAQATIQPSLALARETQYNEWL